MSFNTKGQDLIQIRKTLDLGVQSARIHSIELKNSKSGKKQLEFILIGPEMGDDFEGLPMNREDKEGPKFKGQVAWVRASDWLDSEHYNSSDLKKNGILARMNDICKVLGVKDKMDAIDEPTIEEWVAKVHELVQHDFLYFFLGGEENEYNEKVTVKKFLPKFNACSMDPAALPKFNKEDKYHYRKLKTTKEESFENNQQNTEEEFAV